MSRLYYLQQMGIEPWILRKTKPKEAVVVDKIACLTDLAQQVARCERCPLHQTRTQTVFARGNPQAKLMVIGEAPGFYEDQQGLPFVGKAGKLLDKMLASIGLSEDDVYITNVLKCRPPNNRDPVSQEIAECRGYLSEQIRLIQPNLLLAVGRFAGQWLLNGTASLSAMRVKQHEYQGTPLLITYHLAYLLRNSKDKKKAYTDLLAAQQLIAS